MNKKLLYGVALLASGAAIVGCSDDIDFRNSGEGRIYLRTKVSTDVKVVSRAATENAELASAATIWISSEKGLVRKYNGLDEVPADGIQLVSGHYVAEAWTGDSVAASFDTRWFKGREEFDINGGSITQVELVCMIANSVVSLSYDDAISEVLTDCTFEIGHNGGSLTFDADTPADAKGYFMMSSYDKDLSYTLTGTRTDGRGTYTYSGQIKDAKPTTEYRIRVKHDGTVVDPIGGALITIEVDETPLEEINDVYELTAAPTITGIGFDIAKPIVGSEGSIEAKALWIAATSTMTDVEVSCPAFSSMLGLDGDDFEIFNIMEAGKAQLNSVGVSWQIFDHPETGFQEVKLMFSDNVMAKFPKGDHVVTVKAIDSAGRTTVTEMTVKITDAMIEAIPVDANALTTRAKSAVVSARILKDGAEKAGIRYAKAGSQDWTEIVAQPASRAGWSAGDEFSVTIEGLEPATAYQFKAFADDMESPNTATFTTDSAPQLPNSSFEDWFMDGSVQRIGTNSASLFWDTGNEGASKASTVLTEPDDTYVHSGNYSARLQTKKAAVFGIGKLAAGNVFIGQYLKTDGMDGILGWGRPFTGRPTAVRAWVRYRGGNIDEVGSDDGGKSGFTKGDRDQGIIYVALCDNTLADTPSAYANQWSFVIQTKTANRTLFNQDDPKIIAYGQYLFTTDTNGDGLVQIEIPIDYRRTDIRPSRIVLVASASKGGDYYTGSTSSVMHIDDIELVY